LNYLIPLSPSGTPPKLGGEPVTDAAFAEGGLYILGEEAVTKAALVEGGLYILGGESVTKGLSPKVDVIYYDGCYLNSFWAKR
jgi:hypothetical protein